MRAVVDGITPWSMQTMAVEYRICRREQCLWEFFAVSSSLVSSRPPMPLGRACPKVNAAGYSQVTNVKSPPEGINVKAMKNGKELSLVVDSSGQIQERH